MTKPQKWLLSIMDVANTCVYFPSLAIFLMYTLLMQLLTIAKLLDSYMKYFYKNTNKCIKVITNVVI